MSFALRPPSTAWEPVSLPNAPGCVLWAWFKPAHAPQDVIFQVPPETFRQVAPALTIRQLLAGAGLPVHEVLHWSVQGVVRMPHPATMSVKAGSMEAPGGPLDQLIPDPGPPGITVRMTAPAVVPAALQAGPGLAMGIGVAAPGRPPGAQTMLEAIDAEWQAIVQVERQIDAVRRQLGSIQGTLQSLNRDLDADERMYADNADKKDWQDTRRWLRDALAHVSKFIRAHDIGVTSSAGSRRRFEQIYRDHVEPKLPFPGMEMELLAFEQHRKTTQSLLLQMQSTHAFASRDGVQRAQGVLSRIAAKVRTARAKR